MNTEKKVFIENHQDFSEIQLDFLNKQITSFFDAKFVKEEKSCYFITKESSQEEAIQSALEKLLFVCRNLKEEHFFESTPKTHHSYNTMKALLDQGFVRKVAKGMFSYEGEFLKMMRAIDRKTLELSQKYKAIEQEYPPLWPVDLFKKINYFHEFPQQILMVSPLKPNFENRNDFAQKYAEKNEFDKVSMKEHFEDSTFGLSPAVCDTCYYLHQNQKIQTNSIYTTSNKVFRNESSNLDALDRLTVFTVRDIMFVGDQDFVHNSLKKVMDDLVILLKDIGLDCSISTANDPFFLNNTVVKNSFQNSANLKYEILALIPELDRKIAIGSFNFHLDFFGQAFDIQHSHCDENIYSACMGIGYERMAYALFSQFGKNFSEWPEKVLKVFDL